MRESSANRPNLLYYFYLGTKYWFLFLVLYKNVIYIFDAANGINTSFFRETINKDTIKSGRFFIYLLYPKIKRFKIIYNIKLPLVGKISSFLSSD